MFEYLYKTEYKVFTNRVGCLSKHHISKLFHLDALSYFQSGYLHISSTYTNKIQLSTVHTRKFHFEYLQEAVSFQYFHETVSLWLLIWNSFISSTYGNQFHLEYLTRNSRRAKVEKSTDSVAAWMTCTMRNMVNDKNRKRLMQTRRRVPQSTHDRSRTVRGPTGAASSQIFRSYIKSLYDFCTIKDSIKDRQGNITLKLISN